MIPKKVPGKINGIATTCLLPTGSACEKTKGISHLFEHILISQLLQDHNSSTSSGYTTEDYIILFCRGITPDEIIDSLSRMRFTGEEFLRHKKVLIKEIERESTNDEEAFFRFLWQDTEYEKSPLGTAADVSTITPGMLEQIKSQTLKKPLFFFSGDTGLKIFNGSGRPPSSPGLLNITWQKNRKFRERHYHVCYVDHRIEAFYLLTRILKDLNPGRHIQLSEKKEMSALIFETGTKFFSGCDIGRLRKQALVKINRDLSGIKANPDEIALNELESAYFYGKRWLERIGELFKTTELKLLHLLGELFPKLN